MNCPNCKSSNIFLFAGGITGTYQCKDCGYTGPVIIKDAVMESSLKSLQHPGKSPPLPKSTGSGPVLYLFRHGETYDNRNRIFSGRRQSRLTPRGIKQAEVLAKKLKGKRIDVGIHSHLIRSRQTLTIALTYHSGVKIELDDRIIERDYGRLAGKSKLALMNKNPELLAKYRRGYNFTPPGGESIKMVEKRVFPFCRELVKRMKKERINVAVSAHGNSMRTMRRFFERLSVNEMLSVENPLGEDYASYVIK
jgi:2,3-bisphosphoglycerate-dependent phosphoglycerate mutase